MSQPIPVANVAASSHYQSAKYGADGLAPDQVLLESPRFGGWLSALNAWQDSWLRFDFEQAVTPARLTLKNGFIEPEKNRERDDFYYHLRARNIRLVTEHETVELELADSKELQTRVLPLSHVTHSITLHILDVYRDAPDASIKSHEVVGFGTIRWFI